MQTYLYGHYPLVPTAPLKIIRTIFNQKKKEKQNKVKTKQRRRRNRNRKKQKKKK